MESVRSSVERCSFMRRHYGRPGIPGRPGALAPTPFRSRLRRAAAGGTVSKVRRASAAARPLASRLRDVSIPSVASIVQFRFRARRRFDVGGSKWRVIARRSAVARVARGRGVLRTCAPCHCFRGVPIDVLRQGRGSRQERGERHEQLKLPFALRSTLQRCEDSQARRLAAIGLGRRLVAQFAQDLFVRGLRHDRTFMRLASSFRRA